MTFRPVKPRPFLATKGVVSRLVADAGGVEAVAGLLKKSATQVYGYADPDDAAEITLDNARRIARDCRSQALAADFAALAGGFFTPIVAAEEALAAVVARGEREHGAFMARLIELLGKNVGGVISAPERDDLARALDGMLAAFAAARETIGEQAGG